MYLAAIADAQPQSPALPTQVSSINSLSLLTTTVQFVYSVCADMQMAPHPAMLQGGCYMQHPQAASMNQQHGMFTAKTPLQFNNPQQMQDQQHQQLQRQQQGIPQQTGMLLGGPNSTLGGASNGSQLSASGTGDARGGNKQDNLEAEPSSADGQASSVSGQGSAEPK